ncbi:MAG: lipopolysaccharide transport periplasmic protein LptA [gamma proteobacterium symbiont of Bathyaustriella thionipta]|nr:lipopolysaccharide transport periplasmic protein LptA [gamma proteobacterium symbiont of Bathyaustriella thionipta]MCU7948434.1 lipopolysaccharide transport periplasmic protein LptA [gamma proteobacterium symbiont of Bathyaustriella thionipta]MCU7954133.1 lipopolysaccharide transport periplasmic protein LptA [gamma proteobacterium symbiont of Bathyaustriella thionipta]MCU7955984.1 lipopolysaccharide transport periplasmic protein LptA [gamma proteobacterium symbiont of Bathyaustriella thionipt
MNYQPLSQIKVSTCYLLFTFVLFLTPASLMALSSDRNQPINLEADSADIDDLKGISIYTGNVILSQGSMVIKSSKLTLYTDKNKDLEKAIAVGSEKKLATFKQRPEGKNVDFRARAITMIYYLTKDKIHLLKNAYVWQDGDTFSGNKIIYDTKNETVIATGKKNKDGKPVSSGGRIKVTIQPKNKK